jgi:predicted ATP-grasp superfamily ATP-dependent carboligase
MTDSERFEELYDKASFAAILEQHSLPHPETKTIRSLEELDALEIPFPAIVKPTQGEGGAGITTVASREALREDLASRGDLGLQPVVVQAFVPGHDIDLSLLAEKGRIVAWTIQRRREDGAMEFVDRPDVFGLCRELVDWTGYNGVVHIDLRIDERDESVVFIEANPRFWGSLCYSTWVGVDFLDLGLRLAEGESAPNAFVPVTGESPYLGVTRGSLPRLLLGGWPSPRGLGEGQLRAWRFHHRLGSGGLRTWMAKWGPGRSLLR